MSEARRSFSLFAGLAVLLAVADASCAAEPQAAFAIQNGWVECAVRQDGQPVAGAILHVIDERSNEFAEGETGDEGQAAFPLPRGGSFTVEIKTGKRMADPIRLFRTEEGIEPSRVLLSYGLRPCCRFLARPAGQTSLPEMQPAPVHGTSGTASVWSLLAALAAGLVATTAIRFVVKGRNTSASPAGQ